MSYILLTILFTVYGQMIVKWQVLKAGQLPAATANKILFILHLVMNPWIISSFFAAFLAAASWMAAMTKFELSYAYPFMSLAFVIVLLLSNVFFQEAVTTPKVIGIVLIVAGIVVCSQGWKS